MPLLIKDNRDETNFPFDWWNCISSMTKFINCTNLIRNLVFIILHVCYAILYLIQSIFKTFRANNRIFILIAYSSILSTIFGSIIKCLYYYYFFCNFFPNLQDITRTIRRRSIRTCSFRITHLSHATTGQAGLLKYTYTCDAFTFAVHVVCARETLLPSPGNHRCFPYPALSVLTIKPMWNQTVPNAHPWDSFEIRSIRIKIQKDWFHLWFYWLRAENLNYNIYK